MATLSKDKVDALHKAISETIPDGCTFYCAIVANEDHSVTAIDNATETGVEPRTLRDIVKRVVDHETHDAQLMSRAKP